MLLPLSLFVLCYLATSKEFAPPLDENTIGGIPKCVSQVFVQALHSDVLSKQRSLPGTTSCLNAEFK